MIQNAILIYYNGDIKLGDYFAKCGTHSEYLLNQYSNIKQTAITDQNCNAVYVNDVELPKHTEPTLLIIFSHGSANSFSKPPGAAFFGEYEKKPTCLENGLVYSNACLVGKNFGKKLGDGNASFFGYNDTVSIDINYERKFIECDIHALHHILEGRTLSEAHEKAKQKFNETIPKVNFFAASYLRQARDRMAIYGNISSPFF